MFMPSNHLTAALLVAVIFGVAVYDVIAGLTGGYEATVTSVIQQWQASFPPFSVLVGFVLGHLFWPGRRP
jgi:hypothetical protein